MKRVYTYRKYKNGRVDITVSTNKRVGIVKITDVDQPGAYIPYLYVTQQGKGHGRDLMYEVFYFLEQSGCTAVSLYVACSNFRAVIFYKRLGFFIACTTKSKKDRHYLMVKQLT